MSNYIKIKCIAKKLTAVKNFEITENYRKITNNIDNEYWLNIGEYYYVIGFKTMDSIPYFYFFSKNTPLEVEAKPAVLFDLDWHQIPKGWHLRIEKDINEIEILPKELAEIEHWFEKYLDEDEETVEKTNDFIMKMI